jgi:hypothetical protein
MEIDKAHRKSRRPGGTKLGAGWQKNVNKNEGLEIERHLRIHGPTEFTRAKIKTEKTETGAMAAGDRD